MRRAVTVLLLLAGPALAAPAPRPSAYIPAEAYFNQALSLRERVLAQTDLIATGNQNVVPTERLTLHTFNAVRDFQAGNGLPVSGSLDRATVARLSAAARPMYDLWAFREIAHPVRGRPIWIPQGMGLAQTPNRHGLTFKEPEGRIQVSYNFIPNVGLDETFAGLLDKRGRDGTTVHYSVAKDGWFVISATSREGTDEYLRYHQDEGGIVGFALFWTNARGSVSGERVAVLMSASLGSVMNGRPFEPPPDTRVADARTVVPLNKVEPSAKSSLPPPAPPASPKPEEKVSTGSGFFVDDRGHLVTSAHVVRSCRSLAVRMPDGQVRAATVNALDAANDLALVQVSGARSGDVAAVRSVARLGENVATFGYPHVDMLAASGNFTMGNVTALAGVGDDSRYYQISAPVQQGNSGGAIIDEYGNVVGVVSSKLNVLKVASQSGDFPQNINFALKGSILSTFLESNGVSTQAGSLNGPKLDAPDLARTAKGISALVTCQ